MRAVDSTSIASVGYEQHTGILTVEFKTGSVYRYFEVPRGVYDAFLAADSKGRFFMSNVRNRYRYERRR